ncbi:MAG TPA: lamin tail domain-containing protein, partial [Verrucomicrobiae bacterium]|nr:lamin tail domain-containing protein [Verrucomicrobiae bacterium]
SFLGAGAEAYQKFVADGNTSAGADHVNFSLRAAGEAIGLAAADALTFIDAITFGAQQTGVSEGRFPDGAASIVSFSGTSSPGASNFLPLDNLVINEVLTHSDPPLEDALEVYNPSGDDLDISGWFVSDAQSDLKKYKFPANTVVPAQGYLVVYENQINGPDADVRFAFSSAKGDDVFVSQADGAGNLSGYRAVATFGPAANGVSFGRYPTSQGVHFTALAQRTFGMDNPSTVEQFRTGQGLANASARVGPVVINEIMYHPASTNENLEFIELHNITSTNVSLFDPLNAQNTWRLRKGVDFNFPTGMSIPSGGFLIVVPFDPVNDPSALSDFQAEYGTGFLLAGPYSGKLDNAGETIELQRPDRPQTIPGPDFGLVPYILTDRVSYLDAAPWPVSADGLGDSLHKTNPALYGD